MDPAELEGVMAVITHPETAHGQVLIDVGTVVGGLGPVCFPTTDFQVHLVAFGNTPLVVGPVEVGENLVLCGLGGLGVAVIIGLDVSDVLITEFRGEDAEHDGSVQVFALVLSAHVGTDPATAEVVVVVVDGLGDLGLDVALEGHVVCNACGVCGVGGDACCQNSCA